MLDLLPLILYATKDLVNLLHGNHLTCMACDALHPKKATQYCDMVSADCTDQLFVA